MKSLSFPARVRPLTAPSAGSPRHRFFDKTYGSVHVFRAWMRGVIAKAWLPLLGLPAGLLVGGWFR
jgi:hypothetical protein